MLKYESQENWNFALISMYFFNFKYQKTTNRACMFSLLSKMLKYQFQENRNSAFKFNIFQHLKNTNRPQIGRGYFITYSVEILI